MRVPIGTIRKTLSGHGRLRFGYGWTHTSASRSKQGRLLSVRS